MPQFYLEKAGVKLSDFKGSRPGFSGSHDTTIALVKSGSYQAGVLNENVWKQRLSENPTIIRDVYPIWKTPPYKDYHWLAQGNLDKRFGRGFTKRLIQTFISFDKSTRNQKIILNMFSAERFIQANEKDYRNIEQIGRKLGKIR